MTEGLGFQGSDAASETKMSQSFRVSAEHMPVSSYYPGYDKFVIACHGFVLLGAWADAILSRMRRALASSA